jgi:hypothetical protein
MIAGSEIPDVVHPGGRYSDVDEASDSLLSVRSELSDNCVWAPKSLHGFFLVDLLGFLRVLRFLFALEETEDDLDTSQSVEDSSLIETTSFSTAR